MLYFAAFDLVRRFRTERPSIIFSLCSFAGALLIEVVACARKAEVVVVCFCPMPPIIIMVFQSKVGTIHYCCLHANASLTLFVLDIALGAVQLQYICFSSIPLACWSPVMRHASLSCMSPPAQIHAGSYLYIFNYMMEITHLFLNHDKYEVSRHLFAS